MSTAGRVGLALTGDGRSPRTWSGIPVGVAGGLAVAGYGAVPVSADVPAAVRLPTVAASALLRRSRVDAHYTAEQDALRSRVVARRLRRAQPLDGVVLMGAEFRLPRGTSYVTLSDMTVTQARTYHPVFRRLGARTYGAWRDRERRVYEGARACCAAGSWTAASLVDDYGLDPARVHVVGFGANHLPVAGTRRWDTPRFLFVGREWDRKGGPSLLRAFAGLRDDVPEAVLDVVGGHPPLRGPGVRGHGPLRLDVPADRGRLADLFAAATCFVMVSDCEPFGMAYVEAGAAGVPSIGTRVGGAATAVGDGGVLVEPGRDGELLRAMRLLADPARAEALGARARRHAARFGWDDVAGRLLRAADLPRFDGGVPPAFLPGPPLR